MFSGARSTSSIFGSRSLRSLERPQSVKDVKRFSTESPIPAVNKEEKDPDTIQIEDFAKLDIRVAKIVYAMEVEGGKKILKLILDVGGKQKYFVLGD